MTSDSFQRFKQTFSDQADLGKKAKKDSDKIRANYRGDQLKESYGVYDRHYKEENAKIVERARGAVEDMRKRSYQPGLPTDEGRQLVDKARSWGRSFQEIIRIAEKNNRRDVLAVLLEEVDFMDTGSTNPVELIEKADRALSLTSPEQKQKFAEFKHCEYTLNMLERNATEINKYVARQQSGDAIAALPVGGPTGIIRFFEMNEVVHQEDGIHSDNTPIEA